MSKRATTKFRKDPNYHVGPFGFLALGLGFLSIPFGDLGTPQRPSEPLSEYIVVPAMALLSLLALLIWLVWKHKIVLFVGGIAAGSRLFGDPAINEVRFWEQAPSPWIILVGVATILCLALPVYAMLSENPDPDFYDYEEPFD